MKKNATRLQFLDAVRGIAALLVVIQHTVERRVPSFLQWSFGHINFGAMGVTAFFLVSGFIIPVSIERGPSLKNFWLSRAFRLYPMYWVSLVAAVILIELGVLPHISARAILVNITMLQWFLHQPDAIGVYWTLSLELVFYALCAVLFRLGILEKSSLIATASIIAMLALALIAGFGFKHSIPAGRAGLLVSAFFGTVIFRSFDSGNTRHIRLLFLAIAPTFFLSFLFRFQIYPVHTEKDPFTLGGVCISWLAAYALFFLCYLARDCTFPAPILFLGRISYSLYLVHGIILWLLPIHITTPIFVIVEIALSVSISAITYYQVERRFHTFHNALKIRWSKNEGDFRASV